MSEVQTNPIKPLLFSAAAAAVVLVFAVWPAEFGFDPTGVGKLTGLKALSDQPAQTELYNTVEGGEISFDTKTWELLPFESFEYKYTMKEGAGMVFSWTATAPVEYDFHTDAMMDGEEISDSFEISKSDGVSGSYVAPYDGIHGIFFENLSTEPVEVTLTTRGFYTAATLFRDGGEIPMPINGE
ncbi:MAG: hypothetical protein CMK09_02830 [Ponticaulis sp.]|mgnify:CR=1 FL=1|nr:hypothetical protein [Ponticaulis sp.]|tara:strand:- start:8240 stop:8791 length:552 start_codon:yes stop_codon:yes gene_type:complete